MVLNREQIIQEENNSMIETLPAKERVKPVNIVITERIDSTVKSSIVDSLQSLKMVSVDYDLEMSAEACSKSL